MSIEGSENQLFEEWKNAHEGAPDGFVKDGVVNEQCYLNSQPKLLFVLKEANNPRRDVPDLREFLRKDGRPQTWDTIARWIEGIRHLDRDLEWAPSLSKIDDKRRGQLLQSIVAINLKKSPGGHTADPRAIATAAEQDKDFFRRQFALYNPDLVICCGSETSDTFHGLIDFDAKPVWKTTRRGIWFHEFKQSKYVISFAHPMARVADCLLYYGLVDAVREILRGSPKG